MGVRLGVPGGGLQGNPLHSESGSKSGFLVSESGVSVSESGFLVSEPGF